MTEIKGILHHIASFSDWEKALQTGIYSTESLKSEGFIHFSTPSQLAETLKLHYKGREDIVILDVPSKRIKQNLKMEASRNNELFPHLYSSLRIEDVETTWNVSWNDRGEPEMN